MRRTKLGGLTPTGVFASTSRFRVHHWNVARRKMPRLNFNSKTTTERNRLGNLARPSISAVERTLNARNSLIGVLSYLSVK
jgi:hypothetical protein